MFLRIDRLQIEMPQPTSPDPNAAAAVQELLGGRFGEMSTLMNYMYRSFNFRGRDKLRPYYDLTSHIATEELGHVELVSASINSLLNGAESSGDPATGAAGFSAFKNFATHTTTSSCAMPPWWRTRWDSPGAATMSSTPAT